ncbi:hypothetical protein CROQUDRAFT_483022 [Cronartium quercuum f. sp. fusiforme G11]|uniref:Uncharacterized protein n=1 Tax=Cronartium quercuum f. sp. fusiforme G11 TaxID=708437 RepID=A0A9P6TCB4_9BASI|nr:hypothetical protein CROQUDRAFT_483022 [Cronartium quercuum f. sp. fusiforme G11]
MTHHMPLTPITEESRSGSMSAAAEVGLLTDEDDEEGLLADEHALFVAPQPDENMAGTIFGIQNVFVVVPQFVARWGCGRCIRGLMLEISGPDGSQEAESLSLCSHIGI